eukprot:scaffold10417_cov46-Prasinocladus_malaysianus.AAC.1
MPFCCLWNSAAHPGAVCVVKPRDWVLGVVYRTANGFTKRCGGLQAVPVRGIENANLSALISGHTDYMAKLPEIMDALNLTPP